MNPGEMTTIPNNDPNQKSPSNPQALWLETLNIYELIVSSYFP